VKILIQALNESGKESLRVHVEERMKLSKFSPQKIMYNKLFEESVISDEPYILQVKVKSLVLANSIEFADLKLQMEKALIKNGASSNDFNITRC